MLLRDPCRDLRVKKPANFLHPRLTLFRLEVMCDLVPQLCYCVHELPDRHFVLAQCISPHDLNLLEEVHASVEDDIRMEEDQPYDIVDRTFHDEVALEHNRGA